MVANKVVATSGVETAPAPATQVPDDALTRTVGTTTVPDVAPEPSKVTQAAIYVGATLVLAVLALIGIQGDLLQRLIRNAPEAFTVLMAIALVGGALPLLGAVFARFFLRKSWQDRTRTIGEFGGGVLLVVGLTLAIIAGSQSITSREMPTVNLTAVPLDDEALQITVTANAQSLRVTEKMLLRVLVISAVMPEEVDTAGSAPSDTEDKAETKDDKADDKSEATDSLAQYFSNPYNSCDGVPVDTSKLPDNVSVLYFDETGPSAAGTASTSFSTTVSREGVEFVCAGVFLANRYPSDGAAEGKGDRALSARELVKFGPRFAYDIIDVRDLLVGPPPTPTPALTPTPTPTPTPTS